jgi:hypothetical protein
VKFDRQGLDWIGPAAIPMTRTRSRITDIHRKFTFVIGTYVLVDKKELLFVEVDQKLDAVDKHHRRN